MKSMRRRVGAPLPPSMVDSKAAKALSMIKSMEGEPVQRSESGIHSAHGCIAVSVRSKKFNTVRKGERYQQAVKAIRTVDAVIANRVLTPPGRKPPTE